MLHTELLSKFLEYNSRKPVGSSAFALYVIFLNRWKDNDFDAFTFTLNEIETQLSVTRKTAIKTKEKLVELGFISYHQEKGYNATYSINENFEIPIISSTDKIQPPKETKLPKKGIKSPNANEVKASVEENPKIDTEEEIKAIGKIENIEVPKIELAQPVIEIPEIPTQSVKSSRVTNIPTFDEVLKFAKSLKNYDEAYDEHLESKYDTWVETGWKNGFGNPITSWTGLVRNTIPHLKGMKIGTEIKELPSVKIPITYNE